ncbi:MAG TPA: ATP synthase subunit I [Thioalkalivibrio sp.]|nr:ATP synthase subunit I [Thioalkalivibrio sp.]
MRKRLLVVQAVLVLLGAALVYLLNGEYAALGVLFGGSIVIVNTLLLHWHHRRAERFAGNDAGKNMRILYRAAAERFFITLALFAIGLGILGLEPLPLLLGFIGIQLAQVLDWLIESKQRKNNGKRRDPYLW